MKYIYTTVFAMLLCSFASAQAPPQMVRIEGGTFDMGSIEGLPNERPVHKVTVSSFNICKYEVTVAEFAAFVKATSYKTDAEKAGNSLVFLGEEKQAPGINWRDDEEGHKRSESDWNKPVIHVSWNDATAYCKWLSGTTGKTYRLPTEAEWEYAAGNGAKHNRFSWGNNDKPESLHPVGNVADETKHPKYGNFPGRFEKYTDGYFYSSPVGTFPANELGLYDMCGNVYEMCNDWYGEKYYETSPSDNPQGPATGKEHSVRGGSWGNNATFTRVAVRFFGTPDKRCSFVGFRVASSM